MTLELSTRYNPSEIEPKWQKHWSEKYTFHVEPKKGEKPFTIVIPPPNITGILHIGHGLNITLQDVLIRHRRMDGYNTLWVPGTDHAGIATQNVVEKGLLKENIRKEDIGTEEFLKKIWGWKEKYGDIIITQLQRLGVSCDWARQRFTMDRGLSQAVNQAFKHLYEKGLIYRGKYMTNWCPRCKTALSDDEVEHEEVESNLWYINYPVKGEKEFITVATTRPETMLGDTAVAVSPKDIRYKRSIGKTLVLPLVNREIPVIADESVDKDFGTGAVKVTPAHDPNDYEIGLRHDLDVITVIDENAVITDQGVHFAGMHRFDCREAIVRELKEKGFLNKIQEYTHNVGHCYRCSTTLEPHLSEQWFVKMKPLAKMAINATLKGRVKLYPQKWEKYYLNWLENVRDWCISRQIVWGHRIPVWYCDSCGELSVSTEKLDKCLTCESTDIRQDRDVLDTWFSSALWPFSTLGWPEQTSDLHFYFPTSVLVTDRGIIYFWVARMVMMALSMLNEPPFSDVYIHGTILDEQGRKMSKSLGNGIDPIEMIEQYGADAVRFALVYLTTEGQDIKLSPHQFEMGRNYMNKIWNATRFVLMNLEGTEDLITSIDKNDNLTFYDRWILSELSSATKKTSAFLQNYKFSEYASTCYDFFWHELCDWYLEIIKPRMNEGDSTAQAVIYTVLNDILKIMHPMIPFITEDLWNTLNKVAGIEPDRKDLTFNPWPKVDEDIINTDIQEEMNVVKNVVRSIRNIRVNLNVPAKKEINTLISFDDKAKAKKFKKHANVIKLLARVKEITIDTSIERPKNTAVEILGDIHIYIPLEIFIDIEDEKKKLQNKLNLKKEYLALCNKKLENQNFLENAPKNIVDKEWEKKETVLKEIEHIKNFLENLD